MANDSKSTQVHKLFLKISKQNKHKEFYNYLKTTKIINIDSRLNKDISLQFFIIKTIIGQQVSVSAARSIWKKVEIFLENKNNNISLKALTNCGLSRPKEKYIHGVINNEELQLTSKRTLQTMQDQELSEFFLKIKGIGPWTLGIIKMFYLGHSDTYLSGDLGVKKEHYIFLRIVNIWVKIIHHIKHIYAYTYGRA